MESMPRKQFRAYYRLSEAGRAVVLAGLESGLAQSEIRTKLAQETGEDISNGSLGRFAQAWEARRQKLVDTADAAAMLAKKAGDSQASLQFMLDLLQVGIIGQQDRIEDFELPKLMAEHRRMLEYQLKKEDLELKKGRLEIAERELKLAEQREKRMAARIEALQAEVDKAEEDAAGGKRLSPDAIKTIRELYNLSEEKAA